MLGWSCGLSVVGRVVVLPSFVAESGERVCCCACAEALSCWMVFDCRCRFWCVSVAHASRHSLSSAPGIRKAPPSISVEVVKAVRRCLWVPRAALVFHNAFVSFWSNSCSRLSACCKLGDVDVVEVFQVSCQVDMFPGRRGEGGLLPMLVLLLLVLLRF